MVNQLLVRQVIGIIGNVISFGLFLSPVPTFRTIWSRKAVEDFSPMPYLATLMNCAVWVFYGLPIVSERNTLVYTINGIGLLMEITYLTLFFIFSKNDNRKKIILVLMLEAAFLAAVAGGVIGAIHTLKSRTYVVGIMAVVFGTCMYASPLTIMKLVVATKSVEYMPLGISVVCFINGVCWTAYALLYKLDVFVLIPNGMGAILGAMQLLLYACYYRTTPKRSKNPEAQMQPQKASVAPDNV